MDECPWEWVQSPVLGDWYLYIRGRFAHCGYIDIATENQIYTAVLFGFGGNTYWIRDFNSLEDAKKAIETELCERLGI
jgi:hypothetical protein